MGHALTFLRALLYADAAAGLTLLNIPGALRFSRARWNSCLYLSGTCFGGSLMSRPLFFERTGWAERWGEQRRRRRVGFSFLWLTLVYVSAAKSWVDVTAYSCPDSVTPLLDLFASSAVALVVRGGVLEVVGGCESAPCEAEALKRLFLTPGRRVCLDCKTGKI